MLFKSRAFDPYHPHWIDLQLVASVGYNVSVVYRAVYTYVVGDRRYGTFEFPALILPWLGG